MSIGRTEPPASMVDAPQSSWLYPRLRRSTIDQIWESVSGLSVDALAELAAPDHAEMTYAATGGQRATRESIVELREDIIQCARNHGYPEGGTITTRAAFDAEAAVVLVQRLSIAPGESSRDDVWSFFGLVVFPDVIRWRFQTSGHARFVGGTGQRNALQRLWWRAYALRDPAGGDEPYHLLRRLPEDALVGIMERPGISSNTTLARVVGSEAATIADDGLGTRGEKLCREAYKGVRQRLPVAAIEVLSEDGLRKQIRDIFEQVKRQATESP